MRVRRRVIVRGGRILRREAEEEKLKFKARR